MPREDPPDPRKQEHSIFPEARSIHKEILANPNEYLEGWVEQANFRERYDLPPFRPPRFLDGKHVHGFFEEMETEYDIDITFSARGGESGLSNAGWFVEVNGHPAIPIDRYRDDAANTVIQIESGELRQRILDQFLD